MIVDKHTYPVRRFSPAYLCFSVCFVRMISKNDAARIAKLDTEMVTLNPENRFILRSKVKITSRKKHCRRGFLRACEITGFFWLV